MANQQEDEPGVRASPDSERLSTTSGDNPTASWTVGELRQYLKDRGGRLAGRKADLVERAVFYSKNPDAAKTKTSARHAAGKTDGKEPPTADPMPPFP